MPTTVKNSIVSWLEFFKVVPLAVGLVSGILGIIQQIILLYSENPSPLWQRKLFWSIVWIALVTSFFLFWITQHKRIKELEKQVEKLQTDNIPITQIVQKQDELSRENIDLKAELEKQKDIIENQKVHNRYLEKLLEPKLEILFEKTYVASTVYPNRHKNQYFRVGRVLIHNSGKETVYGIKAVLKDFPVKKDEFEGRVFRLKDDFSQHSDGSFSLNPDETKKIDIALRSEEFLNEHDELTYFRLVTPPHISRCIGDMEIIGLKVQVTASRHPAIEGRFDIYLEKIQVTNQDGKVKFYKRLIFRVSDINADTPTETRMYNDKVSEA